MNNNKFRDILILLFICLIASICSWIYIFKHMDTGLAIAFVVISISTGTALDTRIRNKF